MARVLILDAWFGSSKAVIWVSIFFGLLTLGVAIFWLIVTLGKVKIAPEPGSEADESSETAAESTTAAAPAPAAAAAPAPTPAQGYAYPTAPEPVAAPEAAVPAESTASETTQIVDTGATATVGDGTSTTVINTGEHQH